MSLDRLFPLVANQLAKAQIPFPTDWLKECLEYLCGEFNGKIPSDRELFEMVYQQWLFCDLREFGIASLPERLPNEAGGILNGIYYVQINGMLDVSRSLYSQYRHLTGSSVDIEENETGEAIPEPKAKRLLVLELTDGVSTYRGIEYKIISELQYSVRPGAKGKIVGSVRCFKEFMLLTPENFCLLGGSCDSLDADDSAVSVLERKLNIIKCKSADAKQVSLGRLEKNERISLELSSQPSTTTASVSSKAPTKKPPGPPLSCSTITAISPLQDSSTQTDDDVDHFRSVDSIGNLDDYWIGESTSQDDYEVEPLVRDSVPVVTEEEPLETSQKLAIIELGPDMKITVESSVTSGIHISCAGLVNSTPVQLLADLRPGIGKYLIRGIILTTIGKLDPNRGSHWSLAVKVNDGTAAMDMKMDDTLLTRLIGISPKQAWAIKTGVVADPVQRNLAAEGLKNCGTFLRDFDGILEVLFTCPNEMPIICGLLSILSLKNAVP